ncbi:MAG: MerR family transcriptional regulator [Anaerolinea sp.]|nr:MerR family transcriptional regulator [Anaerolinea sp.]
MFTVGEFATLARVSKRLLRYYDEIDLLKPAHTDRATGYRYYTAEQMAHLNRILVLKDLGLSLDQIRRMLGDHVSTNEMQGMLRLKKAEIEQMLRAELQRIRKIEARLHAIASMETDVPLDVVIKEIPAQSVLSTQAVLPSFADAMALHRLIRSVLPTRGEYGQNFTICRDEEIVTQNLLLEVGRVIEVQSHAPVPLTNDMQLHLRVLPAVETMATTVIRGGLNAIHAGYANMGIWAESNGYRLNAMPRELLLGGGDFEDGSDLITEIQFPVEPLDNVPIS